MLAGGSGGYFSLKQLSVHRGPGGCFTARGATGARDLRREGTQWPPQLVECYHGSHNYYSQLSYFRALIRITVTVIIFPGIIT